MDTHHESHMNTKQTKSLVHMAAQASRRASEFLEQAKACSEAPEEGHTLEFAEDAMFYWEQANDAFDELSEIVEIIKEGDKIPRIKPLQKARDSAPPEPARDDPSTVPVEILPNVWDWE